ncbi:MAG TPA: RagB/SusD family nutrient uptake outer membrane protein, partial [Gemmatimonadales bacterium]|nr:RagB/SusD family nutrient uptake outer membrane protein [Gemmatimonadales bacterium]
GVDGCWWGLRLKPEAYNRSAGDPRGAFFYTSGQTIPIGSISNFTDGVAAPKYRNLSSAGAAGSNATHVDTDFPMFRLADAYLIYAEAVLRGGGGSIDQALAYVNALRQRAYGGTSGNITGAQLTLDFILDERGRELLWEAHRRTDLVRFGRFTGGGYLWAWKGGAAGGTATESFRDLYPLPASELTANPNLVQNPGY